VNKNAKIRLCAAWLLWCRRNGWPKESLDALEQIWWDCEGWKYAPNGYPA
jgi:hypothetical protein